MTVCNYNDLQKHVGHRIECGSSQVLPSQANKPDIATLHCVTCDEVLVRYEKEKPSPIVIPEGETKTVLLYYSNRDRQGPWPGTKQEPDDEAVVDGPATEKYLESLAEELAWEQSELESWWEIKEE